MNYSKMADTVEMDSPGIRYIASKNPFNPGAVRWFVLLASRVQTLLVLSNFSKSEMIGVQETESDFSNSMASGTPVSDSRDRAHAAGSSPLFSR
jgi:hypothetical protein